MAIDVQGIYKKRAGKDISQGEVEALGKKFPDLGSANPALVVSEIQRMANSGSTNNPLGNMTGKEYLDEGYSGGQKSPVATSESAISDLNNLDRDVANIGLEQPDQGLGDAYYSEAKRAGEDAYQTKIKDVKRQGEQRKLEQEQAGKQISGEAKAALASLGILSDDPTTIGQSPAIQYMTDVKNEQQREMDNIQSEIDSMLMAAKDAKNAGNLALAKEQYEESNELRKERNKLRLDTLRESRLLREEERTMNADEFNRLLDTKREERAAKNFNTENAYNALAILESSGFEGFENYSPSEITKMEQAIGLPAGALESYAANSAKLKALEGWESSIQTNKNTGEVTITYYKMNPDTKEIETMNQSLGLVGDRFKGSGTSNIETEGGIDWTSTKGLKKAVDDMNGQLKNIVGSDGFISPDNYTIARNAWIQSGGSPTVFDTKFKGFRNPNNQNYVTQKRDDYVEPDQSSDSFPTFNELMNPTSKF